MVMEVSMQTMLVNASTLAGLALFVCLPLFARGQAEPGKTALLLIDIQHFYFPGGKSELVNPAEAGLNAKKLLEKFRDTGSLVVHVRHNSEPGGKIHESVQPLEGEKVISKDEVNAFNGTDLLEYLKSHGVEKLVIAGMMTHMCVEGATRAAHDYGFECTVVQDACATKALKFGDVEVNAKDVHYSTLATLNRYYAKVVDTETFLNALK
jgi:nicotinamidase-related amidase